MPRAAAKAKATKGDNKGESAQAGKGDKKEEGKKSDNESRILSKPEGKKDGDANKGEGKPGDGKDGNKSDAKGKGDNKAEAKGQQNQKPSDSQNSGQQAQSKGQQGQQQPGGNKGDGQQKPQQQPNNPEQPTDAEIRRQIHDASDAMRKAEQDLEKSKRENAVEDQTEALNRLKGIQKRLEELLRQLREEEIERILADLQRRCEKMLAMQTEVRDGTVLVYKAIGDNPDKKANRGDIQKALTLSNREDEIVDLAGKTIDMLKSEGTAIAFPEVLIQVRTDMMNVVRRLRSTDTELVTQAIENDIIDSLKDMVEAFKRAKEASQQKPGPPKPGSPSPSPLSQKLIDLLQELKMVRAMEVRVYTRTMTYAREYPHSEQLPLPRNHRHRRGAREGRNGSQGVEGPGRLPGEDSERRQGHCHGKDPEGISEQTEILEFR